MNLVVSVKELDHHLETCLLSVQFHVPAETPIYLWAVAGHSEYRHKLKTLRERYLSKFTTVKFVRSEPTHLDDYLILPDEGIILKPIKMPFPHDAQIARYSHGVKVEESRFHTLLILRQNTGMYWLGQFGNQFYMFIQRGTVPPPFVYERFRTFLRVPLFNMNLESKPPLVSALTVTRKRLERLKVAVRCWQRQTYPNKELIIVCDDDEVTKNYIEELGDVRIKLHYYTKNEIRNLLGTEITLGQLRNLSIKHAQGEYLIQWDDDDWYHPGRISAMMEVAQSHSAQVVTLGKWILAAPEISSYAVSGYRADGWEGSTLWHRSVFEKHEYPSLKRGEDTVLQQSIIKGGGFKCYTIKDEAYAYLYLYLAHGRNTWGMNHFKEQLTKGRAITNSDLITFINNVFGIETGPPEEADKSWTTLIIIIAILFILNVIIFYLAVIRNRDSK
jgi:glycosyltransferase involved in cell wall biosynthesis